MQLLSPRLTASFLPRRAERVTKPEPASASSPILDQATAACIPRLEAS